MNLKSQQLTIDGNIVVDHDEVMKIKKQENILRDILGDENCTYETIAGKKVFIYRNIDGIKNVILNRSVTYLGGNGQHPIFKKRSQLPNWFKTVSNNIKGKTNYKIIFLGVYCYKGNLIFTRFIEDTYLTRKMNNSAAHVYINDLYQAMEKGVFKKIDKFGNTIVTINKSVIRQYLDSQFDAVNSIFDVITQFNDEFPFDRWISANEAIDHMYESGFSQWRQTEWAGWYVECLVDMYTKMHRIENRIKYVGLLGKAETDLDFDLLIDESYYGDLKASSNSSGAILLNDQSNLINALETYKKFWYVVYLHDTRKDKDFEGYPMTKYRSLKIHEVDNTPDDKVNLLSYHNKMKHSVLFNNMIIIELNKANYRFGLEDFNQGVQPDGNPRNPKFKISKKYIDNFIVYRYKAK